MKYIRKALGMLIGAVIVMVFTAGIGYAHSINGVDSVTSWKVIQYGSLSLTSGSGSVSHSLNGTPTVALYMADYASAGNGSGTTFKHKITGTNSVTFYAYNGGDVAGTSTNDFNGNYLLGK